MMIIIIIVIIIIIIIIMIITAISYKRNHILHVNNVGYQHQSWVSVLTLHCMRSG